MVSKARLNGYKFIYNPFKSNFIYFNHKLPFNINLCGYHHHSPLTRQDRKKSCKPITTENKEKFTFPTIFQLLFVHNKQKVVCQSNSKTQCLLRFSLQLKRMCILLMTLQRTFFLGPIKFNTLAIMAGSEQIHVCPLTII